MLGVRKRICNPREEESELRRGPWTLEEDTLLTHYITRHGEGRWNMLARGAGKLKTSWWAVRQLQKVKLSDFFCFSCSINHALTLQDWRELERVAD